MFQIDGERWPYPCNVEREAALTASDISGLMLDRSYFNDVLGTYMSYQLTIAVPLTALDDYTALYELLTDPVDGHAFVFPYNQATIRITARVDAVHDTWVRMHSGQYWKGIRFNVTANHPSRQYSMGEAVTRGRSPLPPVLQPKEGASFTWSEGRWVVSATYDDADEIYY